MPAMFAPHLKPAGPGLTNYRVFVGPGTAFEPRSERGVKLDEITDGIGMTLLIAEAADPVIWTKPDELPFDPKGKLPRLGTSEAGILVAMCHGHVVFLAPNPADEALRAIITRNGGEKTAPPAVKSGPIQLRPVELECRRRTAESISDKERLQGEWIVRGGKVDQLPLSGDDITGMKPTLADGMFTLPSKTPSRGGSPAPTPSKRRRSNSPSPIAPIGAKMTPSSAPTASTATRWSSTSRSRRAVNARPADRGCSRPTGSSCPRTT